MLKELVIAIQSYFDAHQFIRQHRLWKWILIPGILYTLLALIGFYFFWSSSGQAVDWLSRKTGLINWLQKERNEFLSFLFLMLGIMLRLIMTLFYFSLFKYLYLIIGSPVFAYLSEKTSSILEGKPTDASLRMVMKDAWRGSRLALRNTVWQTVYMLLLFFVSFIPLIGWITPLIALFIEFYYYGFSMMDYSCQRKNMNEAAAIHFTGHHRGLAIGNGLLFYAMHIVPVLAPAYAVVAATLSLHRITQNKP